MFGLIRQSSLIGSNWLSTGTSCDHSGFGDRPARPQRGAPIVRSMPARFRLAGPFVLRKLAEQDALEAFAGRDGFHYRRIDGKLADHRYYQQSEMPPHIAALPPPRPRQWFSKPLPNT